MTSGRKTEIKYNTFQEADDFRRKINLNNPLKEAKVKKLKDHFVVKTRYRISESIKPLM